MSRFLAIAAALVASFTSLGAQADTWHRADTHHFTIYSDGDSRTLERFATKAEMFDALFREYFGIEAKQQPTKLTVYMLARSDDVGELADSTNLAGFYRVGREESFAVSNRARGTRSTDLTGQTVLFHEYVHHLMANNFTYAYPAWYREGFAEYFATATFDNDGDWTLGDPANHRAYSLRNVNIPLERVLFGDTGGMNGAATSAYYGRAWLMVHMFANDEDLTARLNDYLTKLGTGTPPEEAFATTFGDVDEMDRALDNYRDGRLSTMRSLEPIGITGTVQVSRLDDVASDLVEIGLYRRTGYELDEALSRIRALAAGNPQRVDVLTELALLERVHAEQGKSENWGPALAAADRALAIDPRNSAMNALKAELLMESDAPDWTAIRTMLELAISSDPTTALPLRLRYESYMLANERPPVEVVNGLFRAFQMRPEDPNLRVSAAYALHNEGLRDQAIQLVEFLASDPHSGEFGRRVLEDLRGG